MKTDVNIFPEEMGHTMVIGKTGSGKTTFTLMNAIMERCIPRNIEIADVAELKFPQNKGKGKNRGKK